MLNTFKKYSFWIAIVTIMLLLLTWISLGASTKYNLDQSNKELIRGVDVSNYQGEINWEAFDAQDIRFAFIKATEGSYYADETFEKNAEAAERHGIYVGAYLFFDYNDDAQKQAELFIKTVPKKTKRLPPVVDIENLPLDDLSSYDDIQELYVLADMLITDYSSVFFDYAHSKRPILFFVPDLNHYIENVRGLYLNMEKELPGPLIKDNDEYIDDVVNSAPLHDIGKIKVSDVILNKPGKLTDDEFEEMKKHTLAGNEIIQQAMELVSTDSGYLKVYTLPGLHKTYFLLCYAMFLN